MFQVGFKLAGAVLIFFACGAAGWQKGEQLTRRVRILEDMIIVLNHLHDSLRFEIGSTYEILQKASQNLLLRELRLPFGGLSDGPSLRADLSRVLEELYERYKVLIHEHEFQYFVSCLSGLTNLPTGQEEKLLEYSASQLSLLVRNAREECDQQKKLYRVMGFSFGGMAALLLL